MQNRKRDTDVQNRLLDSVGEGEGGMFRENSIKTCIFSILLNSSYFQDAQLHKLYPWVPLLCVYLMGLASGYK